MNAADFIVLVIIGVSALFSLKRGFTVEAVSLFSWLAAFIIGRIFSPPLAYLLSDFLNPPSVREPIAFGLLFIATLIVAGLVKQLLKKIINATGLSATDRLLGMFFGAARGLLIAVLLVGFLTRVMNVSQDPWWQNSQLIPHLLMIETWVYDVTQGLWQNITQLSTTV